MEKLMFALGVIAGEGSFSGCTKRPRVAVKQKDNLRLLGVLVEVFGGRVNGPYRYKQDKYKAREYHMWSLDGPDLVAALPKLAAMPDCWKRDQMLEWSRKYGMGL
jgi:hypothetical protein